MHLAILMTNTDESDFAQQHPKDGEKFTDLIQLSRPDWTTEVFSVKDGVFPDDLSRFDGVIITGSPASVRNDAGWTRRLLDLIRTLHGQEMPIFGACFGHQAIALALGGALDDNPEGWVHGLTPNEIIARESWMGCLPDRIHLCASHKEQVSALPEGARNLMVSTQCMTSGFAIGRHIYTTQHHPEMSAGFIAALTEDMAPILGAELAERARSSLTHMANQRDYALSIAEFFEQARSV
ncbi:type 1 glutamine amidotransferase [Ruegeria sp. 2205SS24-7]|uniref:type 1 glutamine amidotransferase n=1 Tax=Ruegeria discodermiae TaxID=3064389 RepID=UPI0027419252|nr:type 1 glutamine amidotransferase [Ruegeria sp. 2205SS24-7]MDP5218598.1 type 1 glutamine amidotransferase [Ruegeria sp. 2205SS24-7]